MRVHKAANRVVVLMAVALSIGLVAPAASAGGRHHHRRPPRVAGMVFVESDRTFEDSWAALDAALVDNTNINVVARIDHAAAAASVGLELDPNRVIVFGNPRLGSPLMAVNQTVGIDLPQKIQIIETKDRVWVGFNDATYLRARHRLGDQPTLETIAGALRTFAGLAADDDVDGKAFGVGRFRHRPGLITVASDADIDTTWDRLLSAIADSPANVAFQVDHQAGATGLGFELRPTRLVAFGNPRLGTPLMQERPTAGIDLPIKFLVWDDEAGQTFVTTNDERLARRHGIRRTDLDPIAGAVENFLNVATVTP